MTLGVYSLDEILGVNGARHAHIIAYEGCNVITTET